MIYMLELFLDKQRREPVPVELDLMCSSVDNGQFNTVFAGVNQYPFKDILPAIGHSYIREIIADPESKLIVYNLTDITTGQFESIKLGENNMNGSVNEQVKEELIKTIKEVKFEGANHFTGIEWRNMVTNSLFPIRYRASFSLLQYGQRASLGSMNVTYNPYNALVPDHNMESNQYPVEFQNTRVMKGCICYDVSSGTCNTGMSYAF
jgi:hypothetical protein